MRANGRAGVGGERMAIEMGQGVTGQACGCMGVRWRVVVVGGGYISLSRMCNVVLDLRMRSHIVLYTL